MLEKNRQNIQSSKLQVKFALNQNFVKVKKLTFYASFFEKHPLNILDAKIILCLYLVQMKTFCLFYF